MRYKWEFIVNLRPNNITWYSSNRLRWHEEPHRYIAKAQEFTKLEKLIVPKKPRCSEGKDESVWESVKSVEQLSPRGEGPGNESTTPENHEFFQSTGSTRDPSVGNRTENRLLHSVYCH